MNINELAKTFSHLKEHGFCSFSDKEEAYAVLSFLKTLQINSSIDSNYGFQITIEPNQDVEWDYFQREYKYEYVEQARKNAIRDGLEAISDEKATDEIIEQIINQKRYIIIKGDTLPYNEAIKLGLGSEGAIAMDEYYLWICKSFHKKDGYYIQNGFVVDSL